MKLNERAAYLKGLMEGLEISEETKEGKVLKAMYELLAELCDTVTDLDDDLDQVYDELDAMDEDMDELEEYVYGDDMDDEEEDDEGDGELEAEVEYELTCPNCGAVTVVDEDTLFNEKISCPNCGAEFDIEFTECDGECDGCTDCEAPEEEEDLTRAAKARKAGPATVVGGRARLCFLSKRRREKVAYDASGVACRGLFRLAGLLVPVAVPQSEAARCRHPAGDDVRRGGRGVRRGAAQHHLAGAAGPLSGGPGTGRHLPCAGKMAGAAPLRLRFHSAVSGGGRGHPAAGAGPCDRQPR